MSVFWQPELVEHFKSADKRFAKESEEASRCITKEHESAENFLARVSGSSYLHQISEVQTYLLAPLTNPSAVGKYSTYWENSIYMNGYQHSETIRLAQM
jgi:RNA-dependent RNA polymerase